MKRNTLLFPLAGILLVYGCEKPATSGPDQGKYDAKEVVHSAKKTMLEKKDEYQRKIQTDLDKMDAQLDILKGKINAASADAKAELTKKYNALEEQRNAARKKFDEIKHASEEAWVEMQEGMDKVLHELKEAYEKAMEHFK